MAITNPITLNPLPQIASLSTVPSIDITSSQAVKNLEKPTTLNFWSERITVPYELILNKTNDINLFCKEINDSLDKLLEKLRMIDIESYSCLLLSSFEVSDSNKLLNKNISGVTAFLDKTCQNISLSKDENKFLTSFQDDLFSLSEFVNKFDEIDDKAISKDLVRLFLFQSKEYVDWSLEKINDLKIVERYIESLRTQTQYALTTKINKGFSTVNIPDKKPRKQYTPTQEAFGTTKNNTLNAIPDDLTNELTVIDFNDSYGNRRTMGSIEKDSGIREGMYLTHIGLVINEYGDNKSQLVDSKVVALKEFNGDFNALEKRGKDEIDVTIPVDASNCKSNKCISLPTPLGFKASAISFLDKKNTQVSSEGIRIEQDYFGITRLYNVPSQIKTVKYRLNKTAIEPIDNIFVDWTKPFYFPKSESPIDKEIENVNSPLMKINLCRQKFESFDPIYTKLKEIQQIYKESPNYFQSLYDMRCGHCVHLTDLLSNELRLAKFPTLSAHGLTLEGKSFRSDVGHKQAICFIDNEPHILEATKSRMWGIEFDKKKMKESAPLLLKFIQAGLYSKIDLRKRTDAWRIDEYKLHFENEMIKELTDITNNWDDWLKNNNVSEIIPALSKLESSGGTLSAHLESLIEKGKYDHSIFTLLEKCKPEKFKQDFLDWFKSLPKNKSIVVQVQLLSEFLLIKEKSGRSNLIEKLILPLLGVKYVASKKALEKLQEYLIQDFSLLDDKTLDLLLETTKKLKPITLPDNVKEYIKKSCRYVDLRRINPKIIEFCKLYGEEGKTYIENILKEKEIRLSAAAKKAVEKEDIKPQASDNIFKAPVIQLISKEQFESILNSNLIIKSFVQHSGLSWKESKEAPLWQEIIENTVSKYYENHFKLHIGLAKELVKQNIQEGTRYGFTVIHDMLIKTSYGKSLKRLSEDLRKYFSEDINIDSTKLKDIYEYHFVKTKYYKEIKHELSKLKDDELRVISAIIADPILFLDLNKLLCIKEAYKPALEMDYATYFPSDGCKLIPNILMQDNSYWGNILAREIMHESEGARFNISYLSTVGNEFQAAKKLSESLTSKMRTKQEPLFGKGYLRFAHGFGISMKTESYSGDPHKVVSYTPGEDTRYIDWKLSARLENKLLIRKRIESTERHPYHYIVDLEWLNEGGGIDGLAANLRDLVFILYSGFHEKKSQYLHLFYRGNKLTTVTPGDLMKSLNQEVIRDNFGERTRCADFISNLHFLAFSACIVSAYEEHDYKSPDSLVLNTDDSVPWMPIPSRGTALIFCNSDKLQTSEPLFQHWIKSNMGVQKVVLRK